MDVRAAEALYGRAREYVRLNCDREYNNWQQISPDTFRRLTARQFLGEYCWVVYAAGFRVSVVQQYFPRLRKAFKDFDLAALARMRSLRPVLDVFNNERKAAAFHAGAKEIAKMGFPAFKQRLRSEGMEALQRLPGIGPVTVRHLARNIGLADVAKDDVWLKRLALLLGAPHVDSLVAHLAEVTGDAVGFVDLVLWRFCADAGWREAGARSLDGYVADLKTRS